MSGYRALSKITHSNEGHYRPGEDIPRSSHSPKGDKADLRHYVVDETQMRRTSTHSTQRWTAQHHASPIACHTSPLSSSPSPSPTILSHHLMSRNENGLDTPPNAVGTHHVDGQQTRTDAKNRENNSEYENDQNVGQDSHANVGSRPHLEPRPSPCRQGMCAYTKRRSRNTEPIRRLPHHRAMTQERRWLETPTNQLATKMTGQIRTVRIWGEASSMGIQGVGVPNRSRGGAANYLSHNVFNVP